MRFCQAKGEARYAFGEVCSFVVKPKTKHGPPHAWRLVFFRGPLPPPAGPRTRMKERLASFGFQLPKAAAGLSVSCLSIYLPMDLLVCLFMKI